MTKHSSWKHHILDVILEFLINLLIEHSESYFTTVLYRYAHVCRLTIEILLIGCILFICRLCEDIWCCSLISARRQFLVAPEVQLKPWVMDRKDLLLRKVYLDYRIHHKRGVGYFRVQI
jgi:hypothetical protein